MLNSTPGMSMAFLQVADSANRRNVIILFDIGCRWVIRQCRQVDIMKRIETQLTHYCRVSKLLAGGRHVSVLPWL